MHGQAGHTPGLPPEPGREAIAARHAAALAAVAAQTRRN
jgi:hypothetical protein